MKILTDWPLTGHQPPPPSSHLSLIFSGWTCSLVCVCTTTTSRQHTQTNRQHTPREHQTLIQRLSQCWASVSSVVPALNSRCSEHSCVVHTLTGWYRYFPVNLEEEKQTLDNWFPDQGLRILPLVKHFPTGQILSRTGQTPPPPTCQAIHATKRPAILLPPLMPELIRETLYYFINKSLVRCHAYVRSPSWNFVFINPLSTKIYLLIFIHLELWIAAAIPTSRWMVNIYIQNMKKIVKLY